MSTRRDEAITAALRASSEPRRKLDFATAEKIRELRVEGASVSALARYFRVARATIRQVEERSIYRSPPVTPWRRIGSCMIALPSQGREGMSSCELYWLAGWLEGEGSFLRPPPSDARRPRIMARTRDLDVAKEVGRMLRVEPLFSHDPREQRRGWSPTWRLLRRGRLAVELMAMLHPLMGARRQSQIEAALRFE